MGQQYIGGPGLGLPFPQTFYPGISSLAAYAPPGNKISLGPAQTFAIPAGQWIVSNTGTISAIQYLDPVRQEWANLYGPGAAFAAVIRSDGVNWRVNNLSDSAYGGIVTAAGSGYAQATTTVTAGTGNSTWQPIVGGALGTFTVGTAGSGYTLPPIVLIPPPPPPGIQATATAALSTGTVGSITIRTAGAGYLVAPPITLVPDFNDPAFQAGLITPAAATVALTGAGTLTGLLLVNFGELLTTAPTLTVNGAGSSATATTNPSTVVAAANDVITLQPI
jgi:hypothetical protein